MQSVPFAEPPSLNALLTAGGGGGGLNAPLIDAPLNVRVRGSRYRLPPPERGFQLGFDSTLDGGSLQAEDVLLNLIAGLSDSRISRADALRVPAVLRARNLIAGVSATLPIELRDRKTNELDDRHWVGEDPDPNLERTVVYAQTYEDLLFHSVSYWRITRFIENFPTEAEHVDRRAVSQHALLGMPSQTISEDLQFATRDPVFIDGVFVPSREVIRFISPNPPLLTYAARAIRTALLLDEAASRYARDPMPLGYFTDDEDQTDPLEDDEIRDVLNAWETARRERVWGYVSRGLKLNELKPPTPEQLQLVESRQHAVLDIARATGLDPEDVGVSTTSRTYQNAVHRRLDLVNLVLMNYISGVQDRLSKPDVTPRTVRARVNINAFLRADMLTRHQAHKIAIDGGWETPNSIRAKEGEPPLTEDQEREADRSAERLSRIYGARPERRGIEQLGEPWAMNGHHELMGVG